MNAEVRFAELCPVEYYVSSPAGNYAAAVLTGNLLYLSGKAPRTVVGSNQKGRLGSEFTSEEGYRLARSACLDLIGAIRTELGSLHKVARFVELHGSLNTVPEFEDHARVLDGASDLLMEVFGNDGVHARSVIGVNSLRMGVPLTLRAIVEVI